MMIINFIVVVVVVVVVNVFKNAIYTPPRPYLKRSFLPVS